jgi:hypothetical protein
MLKFSLVNVTDLTFFGNEADENKKQSYFFTSESESRNCSARGQKKKSGTALTSRNYDVRETMYIITSRFFLAIFRFILQ